MIQYVLAILAIAAAAVYLLRQFLRRSEGKSCCREQLVDCSECTKKKPAVRHETDRG